MHTSQLLTGPMPDITLAQIAAAVGWVVAQLVAFNLMDVRYEQLAVSLGATIVAAALKLADAYLRAHRALAVAQNANILAPPEPVAAPGE